MIVDNSKYDADHEERFELDGFQLNTDSGYKMAHYQCNMASFIQLGKWFDYLKEQGVYDNTRIIIVADHGWPLEQRKEMIFGSIEEGGAIYNPCDGMAYNPLLMVKDFDSNGFNTDVQFMTNADTPLLAMNDLIANPQNPFTGKIITNKAKESDEQHVFYTDMWGTESNRGNTFLPGYWFSLNNHNVLNGEWSYIGMK